METYFVCRGDVNGGFLYVVVVCIVACFAWWWKRKWQCVVCYDGGMNDGLCAVVDGEMLNVVVEI